MMANKLKCRKVDSERYYYLECNGEFEFGYSKPLQIPKEEVDQKFDNRIKQLNGKLVGVASQIRRNNVI